MDDRVVADDRLGDVGQADVALMEIIQGKIVLVEGSAEERF
jgi:hypothetical protein